MLEGLGKLFWIVDDSHPEMSMGFIRADEINPNTGKGYSIDLNDEDPKLEKVGISLKKTHTGTAVTFVAKKVPGHESYYAIKVAKA